MHHSKSISCLYEKATGRKIESDSQLLALGKFANMIRAEIIKDVCKAAPMASTDAVIDEFTIKGNVCEMGRLDDENGEHGLVIKRESDFVTIKGLKISELQSLSRIAFDDVVISIRTPAAGAEGAK